MLIFQTPTQTIVQQLEAILIPAFTALVSAGVGYLVWKLNSLQKTQASHNEAATAKLNAIVATTPGAPEHLAANPPVPPPAA